MPVNHEPPKPASALEMAQVAAVVIGVIILGAIVFHWAAP